MTPPTVLPIHWFGLPFAHLRFAIFFTPLILLIDNYDSFTYNLVQRLGEIDPSLDLRVIRNDKITADEAEAMGPTHVIISPGPCTPKEAGVSSEIIRRFAGRVPVLGVCLGHQCIGDMRHDGNAAMPSPCTARPARAARQRGRVRRPSNPFIATRYHSLVVLAQTIPPAAADGSGWKVSAWTDEAVDAADPSRGTRRVVMGLRRVWPRGESKALLEGVQFHPESFLTVEGPRLLKNFLDAGARAAV